LKRVGFDSWEEARARRGIHYMFPEDRQFVNEVLWPTVMEKGSWSGEMRFRHFKTGDPIPVLYSAFRIDDPETGQPVNVGNVCSEISELHLGIEETLFAGAQLLFPPLAFAGIGAHVPRVHRLPGLRIVDPKGRIVDTDRLSGLV